MKIENVNLYLVRIPFKKKFVTSNSVKDSLQHILVKINCDGIDGWGECPSAPGPFYNEEYVETCWNILKEFLVPLVIKKEWDSIDDLVAILNTVRRNYMAKAGLEIACWDVISKKEGIPISKLIGGTRSKIDCGMYFGIEKNIDQLIDSIEKYYYEIGYKRIKIKIAPGYDVKVVRKIKEKFPDLPLMVDANSAYSLKDISVFKELDSFDLMMIEQPLAFDDIVMHAKLQSQLSTPICLDESILTAEQAIQAIEMGSCRIINVKLGRTGGILNSKRIHDVCFERGIHVWCGCEHEFGINRAASLALSSLPGFSFPSDNCDTEDIFELDVVTPPYHVNRGEIEVQKIPGLGFGVCESLIIEKATRALAFS